MSPVVSSSSSGDLHIPSSSSKCPLPNPKAATDPHHHHHHRSQSVQRFQPSPSPSIGHQHHHKQLFSDENGASLGAPLVGKAALAACAAQKRLPAKFPMKENGDPQLEGLRVSHGRLPSRPATYARSRSDTSIAIFDRTMSRGSSTPKSFLLASSTTTAAAKLLQASGLAVPKRSEAQDTSDIDNISICTDDSGSGNDFASECPSTIVCESPPIHTRNSKIRPVSDFRSSMPEADMLPTISASLLGEESSGETNDSCRVSGVSPCHRFLNSSLSSCQQSFSPTKSINKCIIFSKSHLSSLNMGAGCLPPHPSNVKSGIDATKKTKKLSTQQEDIHMLRLLYNCHLQWSFANAKAKVAMNAQKSTAEFPYLDDWATLEDNFSSSLAGAIKALQAATLRLPIIGNVRADITQIGEALNSATTMLESISNNVESSLPRAEGVDHMISELAEVVIRERSLIDECGDLLSKAQMLQVEECSLRGHLIQLRQRGFKQAVVV